MPLKAPNDEQLSTLIRATYVHDPALRDTVGPEIQGLLVDYMKEGSVSDRIVGEVASAVRKLRGSEDVRNVNRVVGAAAMILHNRHAPELLKSLEDVVDHPEEGVRSAALAAIRTAVNPGGHGKMPRHILSPRMLRKVSRHLGSGSLEIEQMSEDILRFASQRQPEEVRTALTWALEMSLDKKLTLDNDHLFAVNATSVLDAIPHSTKVTTLSPDSLLSVGEEKKK